MGAGIKANGRRQSRGKVGINLLPARIRPTQNSELRTQTAGLGLTLLVRVALSAWPGLGLQLLQNVNFSFSLHFIYGAENNRLVLFARHLMLWESEHFMQKVQLCSK